MYGSGIRSEILLARAVHLLTLGAYAWDDSCSDNGMSTARWRNLGGGDIGSVFHDRESAPNAFDWVFMALLREPSDLMDCQWYRGKENTLTLLRMIGCEGGNQSAFLSGVDPALRSGAAWLCDFAAKINPIAVAGTAGIRSTEGGQTKDEEQERKKMAAKEKGMTTQKSRFANVLPYPSPPSLYPISTLPKPWRLCACRWLNSQRILRNPQVLRMMWIVVVLHRETLMKRQCIPHQFEIDQVRNLKLCRRWTCLRGILFLLHPSHHLSLPSLHAHRTRQTSVAILHQEPHITLALD